jgi:hypothetical protein
MHRTHFTARGIRRAAAAAAGLTALEWRQLEQLVDSGAWLSARATVPAGAINTTARAVDGVQHLATLGLTVEGVQQLAALGLAEGAGASLHDRWRATDAGYELVIATRGRAGR